jgi:hypothetical protein
MNLPDNAPVAFVCGGFGVGILALAIASLREAAAMKRWPVAKGRVLTSKVEEYKSGGGAKTRMTLFRPVVTYEYEVEGKRFRGDRIAQSPGMNAGVPDAAEQTARRYASGSTVEVHFNPKRPDESVLEPRVPRSWVFALVIAVAMLVLAAYLYWRP